MTKDFFGVFKMVLSVIVLIMSVLAAIKAFANSNEGTDVLVYFGILLGTLLMIVYGAYLFYSGWTEFRSIQIKKPIIVIGMVGTLMLAFLCIMSKDTVLIVFAVAFLIVLAQEVQRMLAIKSARREAEIE